MSATKKRACRCCKGSGKEIDQTAVAEEMRNYRIARRLSQRQVAKKLGLTDAYVCDLELGRRQWREDLIERFKAACS